MALRTVKSLYTLCLNETARLLIRRYFHPGMRENPFHEFPHNIVHDLISCVCIETAQTFRYTDILLLLTSERVTNLEIQNVPLNEENADGIFNAIMPFSRRLKVIQLMKINASFGYDILPTFSSLLRKAKSLECLETCIRFNLADIAYCFYLQKLVMDFNLFDSASSFSFASDAIPLNRSLKVLNIPCIFQRDVAVLLEISTLLQYYVELVVMGYEVSRSMLFLHERRISTTFKLRKSTLGDDVGATSDGILMTSRYCPDLSEVTVTPIDHAAIHCLSRFRDIVSLTLRRPTIGNYEYHWGIRPLLENPAFGPNLKYLKIIRYDGVSISSIGACCPNLEDLRLHSITEDSSLEFVPNSYRKLLSLFVETRGNRAPCSAVSLIGCLSNATALEFVTIRNSRMLRDSVLRRILESRVALNSVNSISIRRCGLSIDGFRRLAERLMVAKYLVMNSTIISRTEVEAVLDSLNLRLILRWVRA